MTVEFLFIHLKIDKPSKLNTQTKFHHIFASLGLFLGLVAGYGFPGISNASLMSEFSSISLNYKDMFKSKKDKPLGQLNQLLFLLNFTVFRILLFPLLVYYNIQSTHQTIKHMSTLRQFCALLTVTSSIVVTVLQFYWYNLIIKGVIRMLKELGVIGQDSGSPSSF